MASSRQTSIEDLQEVERRVSVEIKNGSHSVKTYSFLIDPDANPRCAPPGTPSALGSLAKATQLFPKSPDHPESLTSSTTGGLARQQLAYLRAARSRRFSRGRHFPALVSKEVLPSSYEGAGIEFRHPTSPSRKKMSPARPAGGEYPTERLTTPTAAAVQKRRDKSRRPAVLPFVPSGAGTRFEGCKRVPGLFEDSYDAPRQVEMGEKMHSRLLTLDGAFLPNSGMSLNSFSQLSKRRPFNLEALTASLQAQFGLGPPSPSSSSSSPRHHHHRDHHHVKHHHRLAPPPWTVAKEPQVDSAAQQSPSSLSRVGGDVFGAALSAAFSGNQIVGSASGDGHVASADGDPGDDDGTDRLPLRPENNFVPGSQRERNPSTSAPDGSSSFRSARFGKRGDDPDAERTSVRVFARLAERSQITQDQLPRALRLLGFAHPRESWIEDALREAGVHGARLGPADFARFRRTYEAIAGRSFQEVFNRIDSANTGTVPRSAMRSLLMQLSIEAMPHLVGQAIVEIAGEGLGGLTAQQAIEIADCLQTWGGLSASEFASFSELFRRFDREGTGMMHTNEVSTALHWGGFDLCDKMIQDAVFEVDFDHCVTLEEAEWFTVLRLICSKQIAHLQHMFDHLCESSGHATHPEEDATPSRRHLRKFHHTQGKLADQECYHLQDGDLMRFFRSLGYTPSEDAVREAADAVGVGNTVDVDQLWHIVSIYRRREGLALADIEELEAIFAAVDHERKGEIDINTVGKLLRNSGYRVTQEKLTSIVGQVDVDSRGIVTRLEARKLIRMMHRREIHELFLPAFAETVDAMPDVLKEAAAEYRTNIIDPDCAYCKSYNERNKLVSAMLAKQILVRSEFKFPGGEIKFPGEAIRAISDVQFIDFYTMCSVADTMQHELRVAFRKNGGFSDVEAEALRQTFLRYDADGSGEIGGNEIFKLFEDEFPNLVRDPRLRPLLLEILEEADEDANGMFSLPDFLRMMRLIRDVQDQQRINKEHRAACETKFTALEVNEFRELFTMAGDGKKELIFDEVRALLECIVPMGAKNVEDLRKRFELIAAKQMGVEGCDNAMDFSEFLWFMRELIDVDFAHMSKHTREAVEK